MKKPQPYIIGIAGPSSSGKTVLAKCLIKKLGQSNCSLIQLDSYYRDLSHLTPNKIKEYNYDLPDALEKELLIDHIRTIAEGDEIHVPVYDYVTHTRTAEKTLIKPTKFVLVEGLFTLYWEALKKNLDMKIYITVNDSVCFSRRLARDTKERGATQDYVSNQYESTVRPMYEQFIQPTMQYADLIVNGEDLPEKSTLAIMNHISEAYR